MFSLMDREYLRFLMRAAIFILVVIIIVFLGSKGTNGCSEGDREY